jgi:hypothetical protein
MIIPAVILHKSNDEIVIINGWQYHRDKFT